MTTSTAANAALASKGLNDQPESFFERWLIMPKLLYFLLNAYVYGFHSLMAIFFLQKWKLTYYMYGYASSVIVTNFFGAMFWGGLADRTGRYKTLIILSVLLYTTVAILILFPVFEAESQAIYRYIYIFVGLGFFNFFLSAAFPLLDAQILGMMAANPRISKEQFNNQRMFGALGHLAATLASMHLYNGKEQSNQIIYQLVISAVFILAVWLGVPDVKPVKGGHHGHHASHAKTGGEAVTTPSNPILACLSNASFTFFMLFVGASGVVRSITTNFQKPISVAISGGHTGKASYMDIGRTASEVFVYITAKYMKDALGVYWILAFSQLTGIARLWGLGLVPIGASYSYLAASALELLKGFNSGLISSSAIPIASSLAPPGCESTAQGLYSGNYSGLSMALGGVISGAILQYLYDASADPSKQLDDARKMFQWVSMGGTIITLALMAKFIFVDRVMGIPGFPRRHSFHK